MTRKRRNAEIELLRRFVTDRRWARMQEVLAGRTRYLTVAVEDIYQPHNASAVLRSCDAFGVQDVHIIENRNRYRINPGVELGTSQWLTVRRCHHPDPDRPLRATEECITELRRRGYRIVVTSPHRSAPTPEEISLEAGPMALLFGTEKEGLTETALGMADEFLRIPMVGFVESLNISVCAAISLQILARRLRGTESPGEQTGAEPLPWHLRDDEQQELLHEWLLGSVPHGERIIARELGDRREEIHERQEMHEREESRPFNDCAGTVGS
jgi:tRNA (guanosine-2'-O-)-methyltransferase